MAFAFGFGCGTSTKALEALSSEAPVPALSSTPSAPTPANGRLVNLGTASSLGLATTSPFTTGEAGVGQSNGGARKPSYSYA